MHSVITSRHVPPSIVSPMLLMQKSIWPRESFRVEKMLEIISEVRYPSIPESSCQNNMSEGGSTITDDISRLDLKVITLTRVYTCTQPFTENHMHIQEDNGSLLKCLAVATEIFGQLKIGKLSPSLQTLVESLVSVHACTCTCIDDCNVLFYSCFHVSRTKTPMLETWQSMLWEGRVWLTSN